MPPVAVIDVLFQPADGVCSSPETALAAMDAAGIAVAIISPCNRITCERQWACVDTRIEDVARFVRASIRFAGLCGYNPFDPADSLREMDATRALGFRGVYVHLDSFGIPLDDARFYPLYGKAAELKFPAVVQCSGPEPGAAQALRRVCHDFPDLALAFSYPAPTSELFAAAADCDRLAWVLDSSALSSLVHEHPALLEDRQLVERCLWGSNGALLATTVTDAQDLGLPQQIRLDILRNNALRFFSAAPPSRCPRGLDDSMTLAER